VICQNLQFSNSSEIHARKIIGKGGTIIGNFQRNTCQKNRWRGRINHRYQHAYSTRCDCLGEMEIFLGSHGWFREFICRFFSLGMLR
jgi:hypothetical protein